MTNPTTQARTRLSILRGFCLFFLAAYSAQAQFPNLPYGAFSAPISIASGGSASLSFHARQGDSLILWTGRVGLPAPICGVVKNSFGAIVVARFCSGGVFSRSFTAPADDTYTETVDGNNSFRFWLLALCTGSCPAASTNIAATLAAPILQPGASLTGQVNQANPLAAFTVTARAGNAYGFTFTSGTSGAIEIVNVFTPNGTTPQLTGSGKTLSANISTPTAGTYLVLVSNYQETTADPFTIRLSCTGGNCAAPNILDPATFVQQLYLDLLGRPGDAAGVQAWANHLFNGSTRAQVAFSFFNSPEFQQAGQFAIATYIAVLGRDPDFSGWQYWSNTVKQGTDPATMVNAFIQSTEFQNTYSTLGNAAFINLVYQNVLGRAPDTNGSNYWTGLLNSGQSTRAQIMLGFIYSVEYQNRIRNHSLALLLYMGFLRRTADPSGAQYWTSALDTGTAPTTVLDQFINSGEYLARFN